MGWGQNETKLNICGGKQYAKESNSPQATSGIQNLKERKNKKVVLFQPEKANKNKMGWALTFSLGDI